MLTIKIEWGRPKDEPVRKREYPNIEQAIRLFTPAAYVWVRMNAQGRWVGYLSTADGDQEEEGASIAAVMEKVDAAVQEWLKEEGLSA